MKQKKAQNVYLRRRPRKNGNIALFLDISGNGERSSEYLKLYLVPELTREDKLKNKETLRLAEAIRAQRLIEVQAKQFGVDTTEYDNAKFFDVMLRIIEKKDGTTRTSWLNCKAHVHRYEPNDNITFREITKQWVSGFRDYLDYEAKQWDIDDRKRIADAAPISQGTKALMFQKFCTVFNIAMREGIIRINPTIGIERFKEPESEREFLTIDELLRLQQTPPPDEGLARAFYFSCLTGLRWSDIVNLTWGEVQELPSGIRIVFRQQKTGGLEYLDINEQAASMLGERAGENEHVFVGLGGLQAARNKIAAWVRCAGINKHITFHCARHTFAVMMLDLGVDLYTVSKLLGHKSIDTTQVYAKILDKNKRAAVEKIPPIFTKKEE